MQSTNFLRGLCLTVSFLLSLPASAAIYVSGRDTNLYTIDVNTGVPTLVGSTSVAMDDLAYYNGAMFGISGGSLYSINRTTGASTLIGATGATISALVFGTDGTLYAAGSQTFYTINPGTGTATQVGSNGSHRTPGDLEFLNGTLYMSARSSNPVVDQMYTVAPATGVATALPNTTNYSLVNGLAAEGGVLYGFSFVAGFAPPGTPNAVITLNTTTGVGTLISNYASNLSIQGATTVPTDVPEPGSFTLAAVAAAGLAALAGRRRR